MFQESVVQPTAWSNNTTVSSLAALCTDFSREEERSPWYKSPAWRWWLGAATPGRGLKHHGISPIGQTSEFLLWFPPATASDGILSSSEACSSPQHSTDLL